MYLELMKTAKQLCEAFWKGGDPLSWQALSQKQSDWLSDLANREGRPGVTSRRGDWIGDDHAFLVRRFHSTNRLEIRPDA